MGRALPGLLTHTHADKTNMPINITMTVQGRLGALDASCRIQIFTADMSYCANNKRHFLFCRCLTIADSKAVAEFTPDALH